MDPNKHYEARAIGIGGVWGPKLCHCLGNRKKAPGAKPWLMTRWEESNEGATQFGVYLDSQRGALIIGSLEAYYPHSIYLDLSTPPHGNLLGPFQFGLKGNWKDTAFFDNSPSQGVPSPDPDPFGTPVQGGSHYHRRKDSGLGLNQFPKPSVARALGVDSPFFSTIVLSKTSRFPSVSGGFLERRIPKIQQHSEFKPPTT